MKVQDIMSRSVRTCTPETNLATAASELWKGDCGALPVVDEDGEVLGMITDRDICIAAATKGRAPAEIHVEEVMARGLACCQAQDDVHDAMQKMAEARVRRLPVISEDRKLEGVLSMNDLVLHAGRERSRAAIPYTDVMRTLQAVSRHQS